MPATPETDSTPALASADDWIGRTLLGRFEVHGLIADGGMGRVYRGVQRALSRPIAIKRIHPELLSVPGVVGRFMSEARLVSSLTHPNVVRVYDFGQTPQEEGGDLFLVMELLEGTDLSVALETTPAPPFGWTVSILLQVLAALEQAHELGITHRDIKPENVFLCRTRSGRDHVKLLDFGIAQATEQGRHSRTETVGTPHYMSPEQITGAKGDASADLYAVGVLLFRLLTGFLPFDGDDVSRILEQHLTAVRPDPRAVAPERGIPAALAEICLKAVALENTARFASAEEMSEALSAARPSQRAASTQPEVLIAPESGPQPSVPPEIVPPATPPDTKPPVSGRYAIITKRSKR